MKVFKSLSNSSSMLSLNSINDTELDNGTPIDIVPQNAIEDEIKMPTNTEKMGKFYRDFTSAHPLGGLLLKLTALNIDLCKKNNMPDNTTPDLSDTCRDFYHAIHMERGNMTSKVTNITSNVEEAILNKELNFQSINSSVNPPTQFSSVPVITNAAKMNEVLKTFPCRMNQKFNGTSNGVNILEFLNSMNTGQQIMNLSQQEFLQVLQRSVSGRVYNLVSECITYGTDISDLYHSLLTMYDTRLSASNARRILATYKAPKGYSLTKVQSYILEIASRVASQIPPGPSRTSMFNLEANSALVRCLPTSSSTLVTNVINTLSARLQRHPTYVELTKALTKYADTITQDIERNGISQSRGNNVSYNFRSRPKIFSLNRRQNKQYTQRNQNNYSNNYKRPFKPKINYVSNQKIKDSPNYERTYNINKSKTGSKNTLYCSLCGGRNHTASQICYKMQDDFGRLVQVIPTYRNCNTCFEKLGKKLFHPPSNCILRDAYIKNLEKRQRKD